MTEEKYIELRTGKSMPYRTPEGYFEGLTDSIMASLPKTTKRRRSLWPYTIVAAVTGIVAMTSLIITLSHNDTPNSTAQLSTEYIDEALDYALIDNQEIAQYLTENE